MHRTLPLAAALAFGALLAPGARAAESYANCTGFIDSLPATINAGGTWCLRKDLSTAITSGSAIVINANNVTLHCNGFRIGGLAAGAGTTAFGIYGDHKLNTTIRQCNIRGFWYGILLYGPNAGGHVVEDNRLDGNTSVGMNVEGHGSTIRRNQVIDTGGSSISMASYGITAAGSVDVIDNTVSGVGPALEAPGTSTGIFLADNGGTVIGNRIRDLAGTSVALQSSNSTAIVRDNDLTGPGGIGMKCDAGTVRTYGNVVQSFAEPFVDCANDFNFSVAPVPDAAAR